MDSQSGTVQCDSEHSLLRQNDGGVVDDSTGTVDLDVPQGFSLSALCTSSGMAVEGEVTALHAGTSQNLSVLQSGPSVSVTELTNNLLSVAPSGLPLAAGGGSSTIQQWGSQNAIITFRTLPFVEGGQEIAIAETCLPVNVDLSSAEHASLIQSLIAQGVSIKPEDGDKSNSVDATQLIDLSTATVTGELVGQELTAVSSQLTSDLTGSKLGTSDMAPVVITSDMPDVSAPVVFTDETQVFTRVCATLNADLMNCVPGSREALVDQLTQEENAQLGIDERHHFTVEASLPAISRVHNRLKDLLNLPSPTHLTLSSDTPPTPPPKKVEDRGVSCRLLLPFVSSKGRRVKLPSYLPAVMNDNDAFDSDDSDYEVKAPRHRRKGRPRKLVDNSSQYSRTVRSTNNPEKKTGEGVTEVVQGEGEGASKDEDKSVEVEPKERSVASKVDTQENAENILDSSERPGVMRTARASTNVSQATRMRRIYEGRIKFKFFCDQCSFKSKRESHYNKHIRLHQGGRAEVHKCGECDFRTIRLSHLRRHELLHKNSLLRCNLCGYLTDTVGMLSKHVKLKHPNGRNPISSQQQFNCEVCGHSSSNRKYFTRHLLRHARDSNNATAAGLDGFQCPECTKTFQRRVHYDRHLRDVHGPQLRPHLCDICGKSFKRSDALQQHKMVHTSQANRKYPFHCTKCPKGFRSQAHLKEHLTMHSSERPFLCHYCGSSFKTQSVQRKHILSLHVKPRSHSCPLCTKKFNTPYALRRHSRTHEIEAQKLAVAVQSSENAGEVVSETTLIQLGMDTEEAEHLGQVSAEAAAVVGDTGDGLQVQQVQGVMETGMEESIEGDTLPTQYIVQGNETASALFYLTSSL